MAGVLRGFIPVFAILIGITAQGWGADAPEYGGVAAGLRGLPPGMVGGF